MATGRVVRFDEVRGYGFVSPSAGGEDLFLHANDLHFDKHLVAPGVVLEFDVEEGEKGLKASNVRLADRGPAPALRNELARQPHAETDDGGLSDVLTPAEFQFEVTEAILASAPTATAADIVAIRVALTEGARRHGWVES